MKKILFSESDINNVWGNAFEKNKLYYLIHSGEAFSQISRMTVRKITLFEEVYPEIPSGLRTLEIDLKNKNAILSLRLIEHLSSGTMKSFYEKGYYLQIGGVRRSPYKVEGGIPLRIYIEKNFNDAPTYNVTRLFTEAIKNIQNEFLAEKGYEKIEGTCILG